MPEPICIPPWLADLLDLAAARVDSAAAVAADHVLRDVPLEGDELAAVVSLIDRAHRDLERLQVELGPPIHTRSLHAA